ncbi:MAG: hypothetical protein V4482_00310 [Pseudomonadota bacterium]
MLKKLLLLSVMPFAVYAMDDDSQPARNFSVASVNGAASVDAAQIDALAHTPLPERDAEEVVAPANTSLPLETLLQTPALLAEPPEPTLNDITQLIQNACDANNFKEANTVITRHAKTLMASKEGVALGLRAAIALGANVNFFKLMRTENVAFKPDSDTVDQLLVTAAAYGSSFHAESLFLYRYNVPTPSLKAINDAILVAAKNGFHPFIELLFEVSWRRAATDFDWLTKPSLRQMSLIVPPYLCAAYLYYYANGYSAIPGQASGYHHTALTHFIRDFFIMNACIVVSRMLTKPLIMKYCYNYKFATAFGTETMDKALVLATGNGHVDTVSWLLHDHNTFKILGYEEYVGLRPTLKGAMEALYSICFRPGIKNRLSILDKLLVELPLFIKKEGRQEVKTELDSLKFTLLLGTYVLGVNECADRLRAEDMPISREFIDNQFAHSLSADDGRLELFLAPNLPPDLRVSRDNVREALNVLRIKNDTSLVNMIRLYLNPVPLTPFNNWVSALDICKRSDAASLNKDVPEDFKKILPPPPVSLKVLLTNIFDNIDQYIDQNSYVWNVVNGTQLGAIVEGLGQPDTWSEDDVITSARPVIAACDDENARRFKDVVGNNKTVEYMFQIAKATGDTVDIIPIRLWPAANQDVSKGTPRSPVLEKEEG